MAHLGIFLEVGVPFPICFTMSFDIPAIHYVLKKTDVVYNKTCNQYNIRSFRTRGWGRPSSPGMFPEGQVLGCWKGPLPHGQSWVLCSPIPSGLGP